MLRATSRLANIMTTEQVKRDIVIIGMFYEHPEVTCSR